MGLLFDKASALQCTAEVFEQDELWSFASGLSKKATKYTSPELRQRLADTLLSLSQLLEQLRPSAELFVALTSFVPNRLDEIDYDRRLEAYRQMTEDFWKQSGLEETEVLLNACLFDLQNDHDLVLRQSASDALQRCSMLA